MKTSSEQIPAVSIRWRNVRPDASPLIGIRVLSPPRLPGASATNSIRGLKLPFSRLSTAERPSIPAQSEQAAAS
jgi:hypothetical protein